MERIDGRAMTSRAAAGGRPRAAAAMAMLLTACRTAGPAAAGPRAAAAPGQCPPAKAAVTYVVSSPSILVLSDRPPLLLLESGIASSTGETAPGFRVGFLAGTEASDARREDAPARLQPTAKALLDAFTPVMPPGVRRAVVTATFGGPGWGVGVPLLYALEASGWAWIAVGELQPVLIPPIPPGSFRRDEDREERAVEAARRFLERADEGDWDGVWALTSAVVKASLSRTTFEDALRRAMPPGPPGPLRERFRQYEAHASGLGLGDALNVHFDSSRGAQSVQVRLDDDQEWRVTLLAHAPAPPAVAGR